MSVYLDIAFLINFLFDAEIIILTLKIASKKIAYLRIILAAVMGGMMGVFVFFPYFRILALPPVSFLFLAFMLYVADKPSSKKDFFELYTFFLMIAFLFGGIMTFLRLRAAVGLLLILPVYLAVSGIRNKIFRKNIRVMLAYNGRKIEKDAVYDSGNSVFYFGKPVIFGDRRLFCEILDKDLSKTEIMTGAVFDGICLVPYKSMGKSGLATGVRLENAEISGKSYYGAVLCLYDGDLEDKVILNCIMT